MSTSATSVASQKMDFMNLLVAELQNQNPLEPMDNKQMASQLAQFSQLELTEEMNGNLKTINSTMGTMNTSFEGAIWMAQLDYAKSFLGKTVSFYNTDNGVLVEGQVKKLTFDKNTPILTVQSAGGTSGQASQEYKIRVEQIQGISA
jgi:flagellar basal-body rod modification protein FlgD